MLNSSEFINSYAGIGEKKCANTALKLILLGMLAGFMIGMGGVVSAAASFALPNPSAARIAAGLLFPFGLIMVITTGAELFTGNCLITISVLEHRAKAAKMARNLVLVYAGNLIGSILLAAACVYSGQMNLGDSALAAAAIKTAAAKCSLSFGNAVVLGILCNILVCAGVMISLCGKDIVSRAVGAYIPVAFFVIAGFEHCVANMYYVPAGLMAKGIDRYAALAAEAGTDLTALTAGRFLLNNLIPVTLGNVIGGCCFAALVWVCFHQKKN